MACLKDLGTASQALTKCYLPILTFNLYKTGFKNNSLISSLRKVLKTKWRIFITFYCAFIEYFTSIEDHGGLLREILDRLGDKEKLSER